MGKHWAIWRDLKHIEMDMKTFFNNHATKGNRKILDAQKLFALSAMNSEKDLFVFELSYEIYI